MWRLKVLHVIPAIARRYGGPSYAITALAQALIERAVCVVIATTDADGVGGRLSVPFDSVTERHSVPIRYFQRQFSETFKYSRPMARWLKEHVVDFDLVHIHAVFSHSSVAAYKACVDKNIPYIIRPLGTLDPSTIQRKAMRKRLFGMLWGRRMLSGAAGIHYSSRREREVVEDSLGLTGGFVVPIGIDMKRDQAPIETLDNGLQSGEGENWYVLFLGRLDPIKNVELLIDAFSEVTRSDWLQNWRLLIAGDGNPGYVASLRRHAHQTSAGDRIQFIGWVSGSNKANVLRRAELFALPSNHENFGRAAVEAMSMGIPVLISDNVFVADEVRRFEAGWVASETPNEIARVLRQALTAVDQRRLRGAGARRLVSELLDMSLSAERMVACYESIVYAKH